MPLATVMTSKVKVAADFPVIKWLVSRFDDLFVKEVGSFQLVPEEVVALGQGEVLSLVLLAKVVAQDVQG